MNEPLEKPKITTEVNPATPGVLIVGEKTPLSSALWEILNSKGVKINDPQGFDYLFQLGDFGKIELFLEKAAAARAKFFLILESEQIDNLSKKAEKKTQDFIQNQKIKGKIIKLSGFAGEEILAVKKILKIAFSQTPEKIIVLSGPGAFWEKEKKPLKTTVEKKFLFWGGTIAFLLFLLSLPITFIFANIFLGTFNLKNAKEAVFSSEFEKGKKQAIYAQEHFIAAEKSFNKLIPIFRLFQKEEEAKEIGNWLKISQDIGLAARHLIEVGQEGQKLMHLVLGQEQGSIEEVLAKVSVNINLVTEELALIEARTANKKPLILGESFGQIKNLRKGLLSLRNFLGVVPWALGERTYLILFQNNFELRPGGGFIGTIGLLTFRGGKMDLKIEDVYTADGQLRGHVEPPKPIKNYLNQIHWYLRDSNWDPDFPSNARRAAWFLEKELGIRVDGVIGLDLNLVKKILSQTGPINLPDYQEKITQDNLFLKSQIYTQTNFFPGSTQKRDFLGGLAQALFDKLATEQAFSWFAFGRAINEALEEKHLLIFFGQELAQKIISEQGWGGEVRNVKCSALGGSTISCLDDYLMVVEANLGVNKVNYFVTRKISKEVSFSPEGLSSKVVITYENTSPANVSLGGVYKNYLRVLTAEGSTLEKISIDDRQLNLTSEVDREISYEKSSTGFLVEVLPGAQKKIEIIYKIPIDSSWDEFVYQLLVQKQPGTEKDAFVLQFLSPWQISETNFPTVVKNGNFSYNGDLLVDRLFIIKFKK